MVAANMRSIGIQVQTVIASWAQTYSRVLTPDQYVIGKPYDQGGFDMVFIGYSLGPDPDPYTLYHSSQFAPYGENYYLWNDSYNDALCYNITHTVDPTLRLQYVHQWQAYAYNWTPSVAIYYNKEVVAFKPSFQSAPFQNNHYPQWPGVEQWNDTAGSTNVKIAQIGPFGPGGGQGLVPYLTSSYYDLTAYGPIFGELGGSGLLTRDQSGAMVPYVAYGNYTATAGGKNWTFWIRPGITFQDGTPLDGRDFVYTLRYEMTPASGSAGTGAYNYVSGIICGSDVSAGIAAGYGNRTVYWAGEQGTPGAGLPLNYYEVHVDQEAAWAYTESDIGGSSILPAEALVNSSAGVPNYSAWNPSNAAVLQGTSYNTGTSGTYVYYDKTGSLMPARSGPFGAGPYKWISYDTGTFTSHEQKFSGYFRRSALEAAGVYRFTDYYVEYISSATAAIAALQSGSVQVLDSQYHLENFLGSLNPSWSSLTSYDGYGVQEMGFNLRHPIWGTGLGTPLGQSNPARAAEAAWHVRRAIEYLVPKDTIIKQVLNGYGTYGITTPITRKTLGFDTSIVPRNETAQSAITLAQQELEAAGYVFLQPPGTISDLAAGASSGTTITLTWTAPGAHGMSGNVSSYVVKYSESGAVTPSNWGSATNFTQSWKPAKNGTLETRTISGLDNATRYWFAVEACDNATHCGDVSNSPMGITADAFPPATIADLAAGSATANSITLSWTAPGGNGTLGKAAGYVVRYSTSGPITVVNWASAKNYTQFWAPLPAGSIESHVINGLNTSTLYWFAVRAYDGVPNMGGVSNSPSESTTSGGGGQPGGALPIEVIALVGIAGVAAATVAVAIAKIRKR